MQVVQVEMKTYHGANVPGEVCTMEAKTAQRLAAVGGVKILRSVDPAEMKGVLLQEDDVEELEVDGDADTQDDRPASGWIDPNSGATEEGASAGTATSSRAKFPTNWKKPGRRQ